MVEHRTAPRIVSAAALAGSLGMILAACTTATGGAPASEPAYFGHVHGLGVDPATGTTYAATHNGVWVLPTAELPESYPAEGDDVEAPMQVAGRAQDTMGFVVGRPGLLLGSGHSGPAEQPDLNPPNLGLISSTDGAATWESVSLRGEVDFHDLETVELPDGALRIYGYDSTSGTVKTSSDSGRTWSAGATLELRDLAADPTDPGRVYATTAQGLLVSNDAGGTFLPVSGAPALFLLTLAPGTGEFIGIDTEGRLWTSGDGAAWTERGQSSGAPHALAYVGGDAPWILIADERGVVASDDYGETVTELVSVQR